MIDLTGGIDSADAGNPPGVAPKSWRALLLVLVLAALLAVTIVLPAERGIDPTGVGRLLGLTEMGRIKQSLAHEAAAEAAAGAVVGSSSPRGYAPSPATIAETAGVGPRTR